MYGELFSRPVLLFAVELVEVLVQVATFLSLMSLGCAMVKVFMVVFKGWILSVTPLLIVLWIPMRSGGMNLLFRRFSMTILRLRFWILYCLTRFNKIVWFGKPKTTVIIRFVVLTVYVWVNSSTYPIFVGRAIGLKFGDLKSHPRWRTWFGECVGVVCQLGLDFMIKGSMSNWLC